MSKLNLKRLSIIEGIWGIMISTIIAGVTIYKSSEHIRLETSTEVRGEKFVIHSLHIYNESNFDVYLEDVCFFDSKNAGRIMYKPTSPNLIPVKGLCYLFWVEYPYKYYRDLSEILTRKDQTDGFYVVDTTARGDYRTEYNHFTRVP